MRNQPVCIFLVPVEARSRQYGEITAQFIQHMINQFFGHDIVHIIKIAITYHTTNFFGIFRSYTLLLTLLCF